jgi:hypothetical protein
LSDILYYLPNTLDLFEHVEELLRTQSISLFLLSRVLRNWNGRRTYVWLGIGYWSWKSLNGYDCNDGAGQEAGEGYHF